MFGFDGKSCVKTEFAKRGNAGNELESCVTGGAAAFEVGGAVGVGVDGCNGTGFEGEFGGGVGVGVADVPW